MLKKICGLFLGLVVCAGSACVTPTHASSAEDFSPEDGIVISRIQASGEFGAKDEYVVLHNNFGNEVDITDWCLMNKSRVTFACFTSTRTDVIEGFFVPPYGDVVIASGDFVSANGYPESQYSLIYDVTNQSGGSIVNSSDSIVLLNNGNTFKDIKEWTSAIPAGKLLSRIQIMAGPDVYADTGTISDWTTANRSSLPFNSVEKRVLSENPAPATEPDPQSEPPSEVATPLPPMITEILANPSGADAGKEFIELYNPNEHETIMLDTFTLLVGFNPAKVYAFPAGTSIPPLGYVSFSNQDMGYTLVNTDGIVQLAKDGTNIGEAIEYLYPKDDYAWALIDGVWQYTKQATPGSANGLLVSLVTESTDEDGIPKPCATNQYRNPETGRCRLVSTASSVSTPCKQNQERNPETHRCRNIATAASPTPCKEGQERSLETNRCRAIVKMSNAGHGVSGAQAKADAAMRWYYWAGIVVILLLVLGYAVWEWRQELVAVWARVRATFAKRTD